MNIKKDRAWIEIDEDNIKHNINEIKSHLKDDTKIMAVIKANAYGHGMITYAKTLNSLGVEDFAVATLEEAINLRKSSVKGNILILGYTNFENINLIAKYDITQTIVDHDYALKINSLLKEKIKVHVKVNTGMNRIGESFENVSEIKEVYEMDKLMVTGIYTHLCVADSLDDKDVDFTNLQINRFELCVKKLKRLGINPGKAHVQSSYGLVNYSSLTFDFVRCGIIMYGVNETINMKTKLKLDLKPVLTLKSRVTSVKEINKGETVSYGRTFKAPQKMTVATVSIGYADGYPRSLSGKEARVLVNENYATVIGRVCMDQLVIEVNNIKDIKQGDEVKLIGEEKEIRAETVASLAGTISYELLSCLGNRLKRMVKKKH